MVAKNSRRSFDIHTLAGLKAASELGKTHDPASPLGFLHQKVLQEAVLMGLWSKSKKKTTTAADAAASLLVRGPLLWEDFQMTLNADKTAVDFVTRPGVLNKRSCWATWDDLQRAISDEAELVGELLEAEAARSLKRKPVPPAEDRAPVPERRVTAFEAQLAFARHQAQRSKDNRA